MAKLGKYVDELMNLPEELNTPKEVLIIDTSMREQLFTPIRREIIKFLREQNPVTIKDIKNLFGNESYNDMVVLHQMRLINISDKTLADTCIVKLNRDIAIYPNC